MDFWMRVLLELCYNKLSVLQAVAVMSLIDTFTTIHIWCIHHTPNYQMKSCRYFRAAVSQCN